MVKAKEKWEKRSVKTASISLKKPLSLSIEEPLDYFRIILGLGSYTKLNKEFIVKKFKCSEKEFEDKIMEFILKEMNIPFRKYSEEFRRFLSKKILENVKIKEQKERWKKYEKNKEYK